MLYCIRGLTVTECWYLTIELALYELIILINVIVKELMHADINEAIN